MDQPEAVEVPNAPAAKKSGGKVILMVITVVLVGGAAVAGAMFGPKLLSGGAAHAAAPASPEEGEGEAHQEEGEEGAKVEKATDPPPTASSSFGPIVVDIRTTEGELHHLKVGLAFELSDKFTEDDFKRWTPRGRQAALSYLRTLDYESATDAKRFEAVRKELCDRVKAAMGKGHIKRVLVTDFVAQ